MTKEQPLLEKPVRVLGIWALYHLVVWTFLPLLCNTCLPLDSIEAVMWGSQWQWGYDKHPPLSAWMPELFTNLMGDAGLYLLSQLCVVAAGLGIYKLGRLLKLSSSQTVLSVLLLDMIHYYQFASVEFNVNIMQLPFWAWGWFFGLDALQNRRVGSWIGLGVCVALGALTKYIAVFLLVPLFAAWWARGELKQALKTPGLYVAGTVSVLLFLPHLLWMKNHDWITITYGLRRGGSEQAFWWYHFWHPVEFLLTQAAILGPLLAVAIIGKTRIKEKEEKHPGAAALALGAYAAIALLSLATGMAPVTMWSAPMPLAIGLWLVPLCHLDRLARPALAAIALMSSVFVVGYGVTYGLGPQIRNKPHRVNYPGHALARAVEAEWHATRAEPLEYLIADEFLGGIVNHYGNDGPAVMIRGSLERSAYLSAGQVHEKGGMVLWLKNRDAAAEAQTPLEAVFPDLNARYPQLRPLPDLVVPWPRRADGKAGRYGLAYIPPDVDEASSFVSAQNEIQVGTRP